MKPLQPKSLNINLVVLANNEKSSDEDYNESE